MNRKIYNTLVFELSRKGRRGYSLPKSGIATGEATATTPDIPADCLRKAPLDLPEADELTVVRHYNNMSTNNFGVDTGFYPLGSCTMKYNPKINEQMASHPGFGNMHPAARPRTGEPRSLLASAACAQRNRRNGRIHP